MERIVHRLEMNSSFRQKRWSFTDESVAPPQSQLQQQQPPQYACPICHSLFKYKGNMKEHMKIQCGKKKPFKCEICLKEFSYKQNLKTHMGLIHKVLLD